MKLLLFLALFSIGHKAFTQSVIVSPVCWDKQQQLYKIKLETSGLAARDSLGWAYNGDVLNELPAVNGTSYFYVPQGIGITYSVGVYLNRFYQGSIVTDTIQCRSINVKEFRLSKIKRVK